MSGTNAVNGNGHVREVTQEEGYALLDKLAKRYLQMSGQEFIDRWRDGQLRDETKFPEAVRLSMMIPLAV